MRMLILALTAASVLMLSVPSYSAEGFKLAAASTKSSRSLEGGKVKPHSKKHKHARAHSKPAAQAAGFSGAPAKAADTPAPAANMPAPAADTHTEVAKTMEQSDPGRK